MHHDPNGERSGKRLFLVVGILALLSARCAMCIGARQVRTVPLSKAKWVSAKGVYSEDNPSIRMRDEVSARISNGHLTKAQIVDMLGPSDSPISVVTPSALSTPGMMANGNWTYVLGVMPKSITRERR